VEQAPPRIDDSELELLLADQRFTELRRRLDTLEHEQEDWSPAQQRLRADLAWRGYGPLSDALLASRRLIAEGDPSGGELVAHTVRRAGKAGARDSALRLVKDAIAAWPDDEGLLLTREQIDSHWPMGRTREQWEIGKLLEAGETEAAWVRLREAVGQEERAAEDRQWLLLRAAALRGAQGKLDEVGPLLLQAHELFPRGDRAWVLRLEAALFRWAGGSTAEAMEGLRAIREATLDGSAAEERYTHQVASEVLASLDREEAAAEEGPRWSLLERGTWTYANDLKCPGRAAAALAMEVMGRHERVEELIGGSPLPTSAHLRNVFDKEGLTAIRLVLDEARLESALTRQVPVLLEEERPTETGFLLVIGFDPAARLLLLKDPRRMGPLLRSAQDQWRRSSLQGCGALLLLGGPEEDVSPRLAELAQAGLEHDERFDLVDRCDLDASGRVPPQARVASLAEEGIEVAPELPMLHKRCGESLLSQLQRGNIDPASSGPFERWLSATRLRFPDAEWPFQIYAGALEAQQRYEEAGIAWSDAMALDPYDERNYVGQARVLHKQGLLDRAEWMLRRALTLRPDLVDAHAQRAEIALELEHLDQAMMHADLAIDFEGENNAAWLMKASVSERSGQLLEATELLQHVTREDPEHAFARVRLLRRHAHQGDWEEAARLAHEVCALVPGIPRAWETAAWVAWASGEAGHALSLSMSGLQRCGPEPDLLAGAVRVVATLLAPPEARSAVEGLADLLSTSPSALLNAASELSRHGWYDEAITLAELARRQLPNDPNPTWRLVQILLSSSELREREAERIEELLQQTIEGTEGYPYPRVILASHWLDRDPEKALSILAGADVAVAPAPVWYLQARASGQLGRAEQAEQILSRLPEVLPGGVMEPIGLLRMVGLCEMARDLLLCLREALPEFMPAKLELARTLGALDEHGKALALYREVEAEDRRAAPLAAMTDTAEEVGDWSALAELAGRLVEEVHRDSTDGFDAWRARGQLAGARMAQGDPKEREQVLSLAGKHPELLSALLRIERRTGSSHAEETERRLKRGAPGAWRTLEEKERHR
jgi:tetratricopeptide (TPR) repeat protein